MKIAVFVYDFPHRKTQMGLQALSSMGLTPQLAWAAPYKTLSLPSSGMRLAPARVPYLHPEQLCKRIGIPYLISPHESIATARHVAEMGFDVAVVLGARVIPPDVVEAINLPIINLHPGVLPDNRGLFTVENAVLRGLPQGVTCHIIDERVDRGRFLKGVVVDVYHQDETTDIFARIGEMEIQLLIDVLDRWNETKCSASEIIGPGHYNSHPGIQERRQLESRFDLYVNDYAKIVDNYLASSDFNYSSYRLWAVSRLSDSLSG